MRVPPPPLLLRSVWNAAAWIGTRRLGAFLKRAYPSAYGDTIFHFAGGGGSDSEDDDGASSPTKGFVALTVDDGIARLGPSRSMAEDVRCLLASHGAHATFFVCANYTTSRDAELLMGDGHELGNHLLEDRSGYYHRLSKEDFREAVREANRFLEEECGISSRASNRWFRAPQGIMTKAMREVLIEEGMTHVLGDCYCDDWAFAESGDAEVVAPLMLRQVQNGSIAILHMPERGFREASIRAMKEFLEGLSERGMQCVSLTEMQEISSGAEMASYDQR